MMSIPTLPSGMIQIPEISAKSTIVLDRVRTALLITDMQNDFVRPEGRLCVPTALATVNPIKGLLDKAKAAGVRTVFVQDTHLRPDKETAIWPEHCVKDTWGWQFVDELLPLAHELVLQKSRYDAFYGTSLDHYLKTVWEISTLIVVGTVSNICVLHTVGSANLRWLKVVVPADGISALSSFDQALTLHQIAHLYYGDVLESCDGITFQ